MGEKRKSQAQALCDAASGEIKQETMPKGGSSSQSSVNANRGGGGSTGPRGVAPRGAAGGPRRAAPRRGQQNVYSQKRDGINVSPIMVLGLSLGFIGLVTLMHIVGKIVG